MKNHMNYRRMILSLLLLGSGAAGLARTPQKSDAEAISWKEAADFATSMLVDNFWRVPDNGFAGQRPPYHFTNGVKGAEDFSNNYWPQAHAMDVLIDAYLRARHEGDSASAAFYKECFDRGYRDPIGTGEAKQPAGILWTSYGMKKYARISPCFGNQFVDDMEWHALTLLRLYEATREAVYLREAQKLYAQIWEAWDLPEARDIGGNGGFIWCYEKAASKNACSNAPGCLAAIRLHEVKVRAGAARYRADSHPDYVDFDYLANAVTVYEWMARELFNPETGQVYGSFSRKGKMTAYSLTYDQGTFLGSAHLLYRYTGNKRYRNDALKAALYTITHPGITKRGILRDEGAGGDNAFFKGIFIRYAVELVNDTRIRRKTRIQLYDFIRHQATTLWTKGLARNAEGAPCGFFTPDWGANQEQVAERGGDYLKIKLGWQVSGATLMEAMNNMKNPR